MASQEFTVRRSTRSTTKGPYGRSRRANSYTDGEDKQVAPAGGTAVRGKKSKALRREDPPVAEPLEIMPDVHGNGNGNLAELLRKQNTVSLANLLHDHEERDQKKEQTREVKIWEAENSQSVHISIQSIYESLFLSKNQ